MVRIRFLSANFNVVNVLPKCVRDPILQVDLYIYKKCLCDMALQRVLF